MKPKWQKTAIPLAIFIAIALVVFAKQAKYNSDTNAVKTPTAQLTSKPLPLLLELGSHSCTPCKKMMPILKELTEEYPTQLKVQFIDIFEDTQAKQKYKVKLIPLQIFFDAQGNELFRHEGFFPKENILAKWKELGIELKAEK